MKEAGKYEENGKKLILRAIRVENYESKSIYFEFSHGLGSGGHGCTYGPLYSVRNGKVAEDFFYDSSPHGESRYSFKEAQTSGDPLLLIENGQYAYFPSGKELTTSVTPGGGVIVMQYLDKLTPQEALEIFLSLQPLGGDSKGSFIPVGGIVTATCKHLVAPTNAADRDYTLDMPSYNGAPLRVWGAMPTDRTREIVEDRQDVKRAFCATCPKRKQLWSVEGLLDILRSSNPSDPCPYLAKARAVAPSLVRLSLGPEEVFPGSYIYAVAVKESFSEKNKVAFELLDNDRNFHYPLARVLNPIGWEVVDRQEDKILLTVWRSGEVPLERVNFLVFLTSRPTLPVIRVVGHRVTTIEEALNWMWSDIPEGATAYFQYDWGAVSTSEEEILDFAIYSGLPFWDRTVVGGDADWLAESSYSHQLTGVRVRETIEIVYRGHRVSIPPGAYRIITPKGVDARPYK